MVIYDCLLSTVPPVRLFLSSVFYTANRTQIDITSIGESDEQALICHTDSSVCCGAQDNSSSGVVSGEWLFPNGTVIAPSQNGTETDQFFTSWDRRLVRLHRRGNIVMPTGLYCCLVPTTSGEEVAICVELGVLK